ncbi:(3,5-dihydroxyphenyl)acetyl-CoA 1,2-dioxygenase DpgC [Nocardia vinacea]|uniref:(3,5-dihydroxyphenyl)acetyl-CoA 1,2-dioxygenase DpgC n=1 Tax=Nocardia vinacea TaxID=96468 RepID=UPI0033C9C2D6
MTIGKIGPSDIERHIMAPFMFTGEFDADTAAVGTLTRDADALLGQLPRKALRTPEEQYTAEAVHRSARLARSGFLALHAAKVYQHLTEGNRISLRLSELVAKAAEEFPGLVPDEEQMRDEQTKAQRDKEGREIDQAIFFRSVLTSPLAGPHLMDAMMRPTDRALALVPEFRRIGKVDLGAVQLERAGAVAHLTIRNLHCLNAEDTPSVADMEAAVDLALLDDQVRVCVLRGDVMMHPKYHGRRVFSAGINLRDLNAGRISFVDFLLGREIGYINKIFRGVLFDSTANWPDRTVQKPWLAAIDTFAIGGGMQLALATDYVIAASDAYFSLPAAKEGIIPGLGGLRLGRLLGARLSRQVILSGRRIHARDPEAKLLCDDVVEPEAMDAAVLAAAERLSEPAVLANRRMLNLADEPALHFLSYLGEFALAQALRIYSSDVLDKVGGIDA